MATIPDAQCFNWDDPPMRPDPRQQAWRRAIDGEDSIAAHMTNETPRHGPFGLPAEPTADKHEQRIKPPPSPLLMAGAAVMAAMILGLAILAWSEWR